MADRIFTVAILGCGARGAESYGRLFLEGKDRYKVVALCDICPEKLEKYYQIPFKLKKYPLRDSETPIVLEDFLLKNFNI